MTKPTLVVVIDEEDVLRKFATALTHRFGADYDILAVASPEAALSQLERHRDTGVEVPIVIADLWLPGMHGMELLTRARALRPAAKRILLVGYTDSSARDLIVEGTTFGLFDRGLVKEGYPAEEWLYPTVSEFLADWSRGISRRRFEAVQLIGDQWAPRSHELQNLLDRNSVPFGFYPVDSDSGRRLLENTGQDGSSLPVVIAIDGRVLVDPSNEEVAAALGVRTRPDPGRYDLAIVGAGPAGLSAAVYGASEGLRTLLIEHQAQGGQAGMSSMIRNYLGFPEGISGARLAQAALIQAAHFGGNILFNKVKALRIEGDDRTVVLEDGERVASRSVIVATGASYRRLDVPGVEALVGAGVFYGAGITEAPALVGQEVFIVGAGNSAGQAAIHLARYANHVTILVRGGTLAESMSDYLLKQIEATENATVRLHCQVVDGGGAGRLEWITLEDTATGARDTVRAAALFVLIGAEPRTDWLSGVVARDATGYILTGRAAALAPRASETPALDRTPALLETSVPGVFAVGDVRYGSPKRVATAVGEGALAVRLVHDYLADQPVGAPG